MLPPVPFCSWHFLTSLLNTLQNIAVDIPTMKIILVEVIRFSEQYISYLIIS